MMTGGNFAKELFAGIFFEVECGAIFYFIFVQGHEQLKQALLVRQSKE